MCGIVGVISKRVSKEQFGIALEELNKRGPDNRSTVEIDNGFLGHARLSIIDTSSAANQPMQSSCGRYELVFNGEIYNYQQLAQSLNFQDFSTQSDTEVLLYGLKEYGADFLQKLNGFFALGFYDRVEKSLLLARDRYGIKPLYYKHSTSFLFASEMKALEPLLLKKEIDWKATSDFMRFNYFSAERTIYKGVQQLAPGHFLILKAENAEIKPYFKPKKEQRKEKYDVAVGKVKELLENSVKARMVADVPLGAFLSGGVDSSIISALACRINPTLKTFSIGYSDEPHFDESQYAEKVAQHIGSDHKTIYLSNDKLLSNLDEMLGYLDEPFADSSSLAVFALCKEVRKELTVALSGDGSDEYFAGYNKHRAEYLMLKGGAKTAGIKALAPIWKRLPKSRSSAIGNIIRQLDKFASLASLEGVERYLKMASFLSSSDLKKILRPEFYREIELLSKVLDDSKGNINTTLDNDLKMVLAGDMLVKVDRMSMANSLEVRVPFLDHHLVEYVRSLPSSYKIDNHYQKKILRDAFSDILPLWVFDRKKHGFEVPLLQWFKGPLRDRIENYWLDESLIRQQGIFQLEEIRRLIKRMDSPSPGDIQYTIWMLIVFQNWYMKTIDFGK